MTHSTNCRKLFFGLFTLYCIISLLTACGGKSGSSSPQAKEFGVEIIDVELIRDAEGVQVLLDTSITSPQGRILVLD